MGVRFFLNARGEGFRFGTPQKPQVFAGWLKGKSVGNLWGFGEASGEVTWFEVEFADGSKLIIEDTQGGPALTFVQPPPKK
jgi:hypothetical protein